MIRKSCDSCFYNLNTLAQSPCDSCIGRDKHVPSSAFVDFPVTPSANVGIGSVPIHGNPITFEKPMTMAHPDAPLSLKPEGKKYDSGKPDWSLLPFKAVSETVEVLTFGANKYGPDNWRIVPNAKKRYLAAAFRHIVAYATGEKKDSESGLSHLSHALCCLMFILELEKTDDTSNT